MLGKDLRRTEGEGYVPEKDQEQTEEEGYPLLNHLLTYLLSFTRDNRLIATNQPTDELLLPTLSIATEVERPPQKINEKRLTIMSYIPTTDPTKSKPNPKTTKEMQTLTTQLSHLRHQIHTLETSIFELARQYSTLPLTLRRDMSRYHHCDGRILEACFFDAVEDVQGAVWGRALGEAKWVVLWVERGVRWAGGFGGGS